MGKTKIFFSKSTSVEAFHTIATTSASEILSITGFGLIKISSDLQIFW